MLHFSVGGCFGCLMTHWGECGQLVAEEELVFDGDGGVVGKVEDGEEDEVGERGEEVSVAIDVEGSVRLEGEGGDFDNEMQVKVEEQGLHGLDKLLLTVSTEQLKGDDDDVRD